jgi:hypothetical protein
MSEIVHGHLSMHDRASRYLDYFDIVGHNSIEEIVKRHAHLNRSDP